MFALCCAIFLLLNIFLLGILLYNWQKLLDTNRQLPQKTTQHTLVSVLIPVRNEAQNLIPLLTSLNQQNYPFDFFEVIVIDDASTDETFALAERFTNQANFALHVIRMSEERSLAPKKRAITLAMKQAKGELIMTTDGDCLVPANWISTVESFYRHTGATLISSPVAFRETSRFGHIFLQIEWASLIGVGACALYQGIPMFCNAANMAYPKAVFEKLGGYQGNEHIASGDDVFLLKKIANVTPQGIHFLADVQAQVITEPSQTWSQFYHQRKRWASKWHFDKHAWIAVLVWLMQGFTVLAWLNLNTGMVVYLLLLKYSLEGLFIGKILHFQQRLKYVYWIPLAQILYPFYALFFGFMVHKKGYQWKNRRF